MANDPQKRSVLDQLTDAATAPPPVVDPSTPAPDPMSQSLVDAPATATGSIANLESLAASPDALASKVAATKTSEENQNPDQDQPSFLKKLARLAGGATGFEAPNSSPQANLGARIGSLVGKTGNALAEAMGTPEQQQLANDRSQMPLKIAQLQSLAGYRMRQGDIGQQKADTGDKIEQDKFAVGNPAAGIPQGTTRTTADAAQESAAVKQELAAMRLAQMNGKSHVTPEAARAVGRPELADTDLPAFQYQQQITNPLKNQLSAAGGTKTVDLGADGVVGYNALTKEITRLGDSPSVARGNAMLLRTQIPVTDSQGNTHGYFNPQTNTFTPISGNTAASAAAGADGVIPPKPTSSILTQGQMASNIVPEINRVKAEVTALGDKVGAAPGRWNEFWVNKGGVNDPDFAKTDQDLTFLSSALAKAHFGGSPPEGVATALKKNFSLAQSPDDLNARMDSAEAWMNGYASRIGGTKPAARTPVAGPKEGDTATGPGNHKIVFNGGKWLDAATKSPIR